MLNHISYIILKIPVKCLVISILLDQILVQGWEREGQSLRVGGRLRPAHLAGSIGGNLSGTQSSRNI